MKRNTPCDFIAAITQHIPDKSFQLVRYYGWYSNKMRGQRDKRAAEEAQAAGNAVAIIDVSEHKPRRIPSAKWRELIKKVWEDDPLLCPKCQKEMRIVSLCEAFDYVKWRPATSRFEANMSYRENSITVSLVSYLLILAYYLVNWLRMYQAEGLNSGTVFRLWAIVIVAGIVLNIVGNILTNIMLSIVHAIKTNTDKPERFIEDERDKLIGLKGVQVSYIMFSIGVFISMLSFAFGQPPLVMFSLIIFFSLTAEIIGDISQLYFYRRGVQYA